MGGVDCKVGRSCRQIYIAGNGPGNFDLLAPGPADFIPSMDMTLEQHGVQSVLQSWLVRRFWMASSLLQIIASFFPCDADTSVYFLIRILVTQ